MLLNIYDDTCGMFVLGDEKWKKITKYSQVFCCLVLGFEHTKVVYLPYNKWQSERGWDGVDGDKNIPRPTNRLVPNEKKKQLVPNASDLKSRSSFLSLFLTLCQNVMFWDKFPNNVRLLLFTAQEKGWRKRYFLLRYLWVFFLSFITSVEESNQIPVHLFDQQFQEEKESILRLDEECQDDGRKKEGTFHITQVHSKVTQKSKSSRKEPFKKIPTKKNIFTL